MSTPIVTRRRVTRAQTRAAEAAAQRELAMQRESSEAAEQARLGTEISGRMETMTTLMKREEMTTPVKRETSATLLPRESKTPLTGRQSFISPVSAASSVSYHPSEFEESIEEGDLEEFSEEEEEEEEEEESPYSALTTMVSKMAFSPRRPGITDGAPKDYGVDQQHDLLEDLLEDLKFGHSVFYHGIGNKFVFLCQITDLVAKLIAESRFQNEKWTVLEFCGFDPDARQKHLYELVYRELFHEVPRKILRYAENLDRINQKLIHWNRHILLRVHNFEEIRERKEIIRLVALPNVHLVASIDYRRAASLFADSFEYTLVRPLFRHHSTPSPYINMFSGEIGDFCKDPQFKLQALKVTLLTRSANERNMLKTILDNPSYIGMKQDTLLKNLRGISSSKMFVIEDLLKLGVISKSKSKIKLQKPFGDPNVAQQIIAFINQLTPNQLTPNIPVLDRFGQEWLAWHPSPQQQ